MTQNQSTNKFGTSIFDDDITNAIDDALDLPTGNVDFSGKIISHVADPEAPQDVATKHYVDLGDANRLLRSAGSAQALSGDLYMGIHKIKDVQTPEDDNDAVNINYFNARMGDYCANSGFTMTGSINMNNNPLYCGNFIYIISDDSNANAILNILNNKKF